MTLLAILLAIVGMGALGLATDPHYRRRFRLLPAPERKRRMRLIGWFALAAATMLAIAAHGWIFGPILATGLVMLGAGAAFLLLNLLPAPASLETRGLSRPNQGSRP